MLWKEEKKGVWGNLWNKISNCAWKTMNRSMHFRNYESCFHADKCFLLRSEFAYQNAKNDLLEVCQEEKRIMPEKWSRENNKECVTATERDMFCCGRTGYLHRTTQIREVMSLENACNCLLKVVSFKHFFFLMSFISLQKTFWLLTTHLPLCREESCRMWIWCGGLEVKMGLKVKISLKNESIGWVR